MGKPRYKKVFFVYLDILGFRALLKKNGKRAPKLVADLFCEIDDEIQTPRETGVHQRYLSDSILLWAESPSSLPFLFEICVNLQAKLLQRGCLIRGAVVQGRHFSQQFAEWDLQNNKKYLVGDEVIVSPALAKGVEVEKSLKRPIVVVEGAVCKANQNLWRKLGSRNKQKLLSKEYYLLPGYFSTFTYLNMLVTNEDLKVPKQYIKGELRELQSIRATIINGLRLKKLRARNKWVYMRRIYNKHVNWYSKAICKSIGPTAVARLKIPTNKS